MTASTPSRQQLKLKTNRLIEELESKMADKASDTANSGRVLRRSPRLNKKASSVQFRTDNPDNSKVHTTTNGEPTTNKRGGTPYKPSLGSTLNAKADSAVNVGVKSQSKPVQNKTDILSSASIISETSRPISRDCSSKNKNNTPVFKRVDPRLALSPPPNMTKSSSPDSHKSSKDSNFATQLPKPSQKCEMEPGAAPERHVTFSAEVVFAAKRSSSIVMRKNTPHKRNNKISTTVRSTTINRTRVMTPARTFAATPGTILSGRKTSKLLQTGAVRMNVAYYTNPKRKVGGTRLLDSGAVRKVVSRYTTPRKLVGNRDMWSPPPSTGKLKPRNLNQMTSPSKDVISTPLKSETSASKRSNASTGGHRFRAIFSPHVKEDYDDGTEKNAPRVLFH